MPFAPFLSMRGTIFDGWAGDKIRPRRAQNMLRSTPLLTRVDSARLLAPEPVVSCGTGLPLARFQQQSAPSGIDDLTSIYSLPTAVCGSALHILCDGPLHLSSLIFFEWHNALSTAPAASRSPCPSRFSVKPWPIMLILSQGNRSSKLQPLTTRTCHLGPVLSD